MLPLLQCSGGLQGAYPSWRRNDIMPATPHIQFVGVDEHMLIVMEHCSTEVDGSHYCIPDLNVCMLILRLHLIS